MTIAKDFAAKASVAFVAAAMILSMIAPAAQAQSTEDLQTMINTLLAQIASLQSQVGVSSGAGSTSGASFCPYTWTRDLKVGATGADVMKLQQFLNSDADTRVGATGAGSAGMETETFGPATAAAVSKFQVKYRAETLTPNGLVNPTGYFGASSRAKANALCVTDANPTTPTNPTTPVDEDEDEDNTPSDLSGEASFDDANLDSADDDTIEEGAEAAPIAELTMNFVDGDASVSRLDVKLDTQSGTDPWDVFETVSLWVDGDMVDEMDASSKSDYQNDDMTLRFTGLDIVAMEDEDLDITIAATVKGGVDSGDQGPVVVSVPTMRYFDADGVADTVSGSGFTTDTASVTVGEAGADDEVIVKTASSDPDASTLKLETDKKSDWYTVFAFDLDTKDSINDITLNEVPVTVTLSSSTFSARVDDYELVIDGTTVDKLVGTASTSANGLVTELVFDVDGDVVINSGDRITSELRLRFKSIPTAQATYEGMTVKGSLTGTQADAIDAEGADTLETTQLSGAATGDTHTLRTKGAAVSLDTASAVVTKGDNAGDDYATYKIALEVTAFEQDVFINVDEAISLASGFSVVDSSGSAVAGTSTVVLDSTADVEGSSFKINEGETETVTLTVTFDSTSAGAAARLQLAKFIFGESDGAVNQNWMALPATDYRTEIVTLVN